MREHSTVGASPVWWEGGGEQSPAIEPVRKTAGVECHDALGVPMEEEEEEKEDG